MVRLIALTVLLAGCTTYELASEDKIIRPRVIAVRLDPPDAVLGETVRALPLVARPPGQTGPMDHTWLDCPPDATEQRASGQGGENQDWCLDRQAEVVMSTGDELVYTVDDVPVQEVRALALNGGYWRRLTVEVVDRQSGERDRAFKRLVVRPQPQDPQQAMLLEAMRNRNPELPAVEIFALDDGALTPLPDDAPFAANRDYLFRFDLDASLRQDYQVVVIDLSDLDPTEAQNLTPEQIQERVSVEDRRELLTMRYYLTDGAWGAQQLPNRTVASKALPDDQAEYYPAEITWALNTGGRADELPSQIKMWFVIADGRGGMDWVPVERPFVAGDAPERPAEQRPSPPPSVAGSRP